MIEEEYQNSNQKEAFRSPEIKSNWWRIILYFVLVLIGAFIFSIPLLAIYPQIIDNYDSLKDNLTYMLASQAATTAGAIGVTYVMVKKIEYRNIRSYRLTIDIHLAAIGFLYGLLIMALVAIGFFMIGIVEFSYYGFSSRLVMSFFIYLFVAIVEEVMFRGYILTNLQEKMNPFWSLIASSILFGLIHFGNDHFTWIGCATISISGWLMGLLVLRSGSISSAVGLHWSWNFVQGPILGFAVSGHQEKGLFQVTTLSTELLTGWGFGAEGSIVLTVFTFTLAVYLSLKFFHYSKKSQLS
jgi:membrane protease YdiL (CAAX protease family)